MNLSWNRRFLGRCCIELKLDLKFEGNEDRSWMLVSYCPGVPHGLWKIGIGDVTPGHTCIDMDWCGLIREILHATFLSCVLCLHTLRRCDETLDFWNVLWQEIWITMRWMVQSSQGISPYQAFWAPSSSGWDDRKNPHGKAYSSHDPVLHKIWDQKCGIIAYLWFFETLKCGLSSTSLFLGSKRFAVCKYNNVLYFPLSRLDIWSCHDNPALSPVARLHRKILSPMWPIGPQSTV